ncbi:coagulation factor 5/8 type domain-containing protein [Silvibacterium sp.]|uniref:coagulation factor 5/8 type domain-containing protein n=1 Tax=Silvibacterium sp. TaxID=1964179 RepID=UPI0039E26728
MPHYSRLLLSALLAALCPLACSQAGFAQSHNPAHNPASVPNLGPNVKVFSPEMSAAAIQAQIDAIYRQQQLSEFGDGRYALLFLPGSYHVDVPVGFYTEVEGLGASPDDVQITGNVHADASAPNNNATTTFWRAAENFSVTPTGGTMQWAVSQAVPFRRMHVRGNMVLNQHNGWASGGWMSDSVVDGTVASGTQQQWIARNSEWGQWTGSNWNMVFVGVPQAPAGEWPEPPYTKIATTPVVREKPYLEVQRTGAWAVRVPPLRHDSTGVSWHHTGDAGRLTPLSRFYIAHAGKDTATTINAALKAGKNLLLTPGTYALDEAINVTRPDTVVLGLGFATLQPVKGTPAMITADVDGISIAGILFDAGQDKSPDLLQIGPAPAGEHEMRPLFAPLAQATAPKKADETKKAPPKKNLLRHERNPIEVSDVFFRDGGAGVGRTEGNLEINSNDTIIDHTWIWRADHGKNVGWMSNVSANGLVVNADDVTAYGLFVEHHQEFQVLWNGDRGRTYFYQSEIPYDPPHEYLWESADGVPGWASYKVANSVTTHEAWGLGIYSVFRHPDVNLARAIEAPQKPGVRFHHMITVALGNQGQIQHVINDKGAATSIQPRVTPKVTDYP